MSVFLALISCSSCTYTEPGPVRGDSSPDPPQRHHHRDRSPRPPPGHPAPLPEEGRHQHRPHSAQPQGQCTSSVHRFRKVSICLNESRSQKFVISSFLSSLAERNKRRNKLHNNYTARALQILYQNV